MPFFRVGGKNSSYWPGKRRARLFTSEGERMKCTKVELAAALEWKFIFGAGALNSPVRRGNLYEFLGRARGYSRDDNGIVEIRL